MEEAKLKVLSVEIVKTKEGKVKARADVQFAGFLLKGFKVIQDEQTKKEYVTPPSYRAGAFWRSLFKTDSKEDWQEIQRRILQEYNQKQMEESVNEIHEN